MLSDEEKKVIEHLKIVAKERTIMPLDDEIRIVLNLIEKQSKEIEELEKNRKVSQNFAKIVATDYISKDKIKAKIIEIKNRPVKDEFITASQGKLNTIIDMQSLLDKE